MRQSNLPVSAAAADFLKRLYPGLAARLLQRKFPPGRQLPHLRLHQKKRNLLLLTEAPGRLLIPDGLLPPEIVIHMDSPQLKGNPLFQPLQQEKKADRIRAP